MIITFYWTSADLLARGGSVPLSEVRKRNYALDQQCLAGGKPDHVERIDQGELTLFRLYWDQDATMGEPRNVAPPTERVSNHEA